MSANVETMMYVREKPWHGLGTRVEEAHRACDFMLVNLGDGDELYAERVYPDDIEYGSPEFAILEEQYEEELRAEIIEQAAQRGIDSAQLVFQLVF